MNTVKKFYTTSTLVEPTEHPKFPCRKSQSV